MDNIPHELLYEIVSHINDKQALVCVSKCFRDICYRTTKIPRNIKDYIDAASNGDFLSLIRRRKVKRNWITQGCIVACNNYHYNIAKWFLNIRGYNPMYLIRIFTKTDKIDIVTFLINQNDQQFDRTFFIAACIGGHLNMVNLILTRFGYYDNDTGDYAFYFGLGPGIREAWYHHNLHVIDFVHNKCCDLTDTLEYYDIDYTPQSTQNRYYGVY